MRCHMSCHEGHRHCLTVTLSRAGITLLMPPSANSPGRTTFKQIGAHDLQHLTGRLVRSMLTPTVALLTHGITLTLPRFRGVSEASGRILHEETGGKRYGRGS